MEIVKSRGEMVVPKLKANLSGSISKLKYQISRGVDKHITNKYINSAGGVFVLTAKSATLYPSFKKACCSSCLIQFWLFYKHKATDITKVKCSK